MISPKIIRKIKHFQKELIERLNEAKITFALIDKNYENRIMVNAQKSNIKHNHNEITKNMKEIQEKLAYLDNMGQAKKINYGRDSQDSYNIWTVTNLGRRETNNFGNSDDDLFSNNETSDPSDEMKEQKRQMQKYLNKNISKYIKNPKSDSKLNNTDKININNGFAANSKLTSFTSEDEKISKKNKIVSNQRTKNSNDWNVADSISKDKVLDMSTINKYERTLYTTLE